MSSSSPISNASHPVTEAKTKRSPFLDSSMSGFRRAFLRRLFTDFDCGETEISFIILSLFSGTRFHRLRHGARFPALEDQIIRQEQSAERDARVGNIEGRPVILTGVQHDEIDHKSQPHAIGQVS